MKSSGVFKAVRQVTVEGEISYKRPMHQGRAAFGCCLSKEMRLVIVAGGSITETAATKNCEFYEVDNDRWQSLPP